MKSIGRPFCLGLWLLEAILCEDRTKKHLLVYFEMCYQLIVNILHEIVCVCECGRSLDLTNKFDINESGNDSVKLICLPTCA